MKEVSAQDLELALMNALQELTGHIYKVDVSEVQYTKNAISFDNGKFVVRFEYDPGAEGNRLRDLDKAFPED